MGSQGSQTGHCLVHGWLRWIAEQHLARNSPSGDEFQAASDDETDVREMNRAAFIRNSDIRYRSFTGHSLVRGWLRSQDEQHLARDPEETDSSPSGDENEADSDDVIDVREINRAAFIRDSRNSSVIQDDLNQHGIDILEGGEDQNSMYVQDNSVEEDSDVESARMIIDPARTRTPS